MFREMIRKKQQLSQDECVSILTHELRGVLSVLGDDGYPYGIPLNHFYCVEDGKIYFHGAKEGHKIDSIKRNDKASFCVFDKGFRKKSEWALNIKSVVVFGRIRIVDDQEAVLHITRALSYKFTRDEEYIQSEIDRSGTRTMLLCLEPEYMTGKIVKEA